MKWSKPPFERFINNLREADQLLHLSIKGIAGISKVYPLAKALADLDQIQNPPAKQEKRSNKKHESRMAKAKKL